MNLASGSRGEGETSFDTNTSLQLMATGIVIGFSNNRGNERYLALDEHARPDGTEYPLVRFFPNRETETRSSEDLTV
jgi:hypothetical protein